MSVLPLTNGMRSPVVAPVTRALLGLAAFVFASRTDRYFAWTINPPLTAAFLGACYLSSMVVAIFVARERTWAEGRIGAVVALVFAPHHGGDPPRQVPLPTGCGSCSRPRPCSSSLSGSDCSLLPPPIRECGRGH